MTCKKGAGGCGHEFCWLCKRDWAGHRDCSLEPEAQEEKKRAAKSAVSLEVYMHHFTQWNQHLKASKFTEVQRQRILNTVNEVKQLNPVANNSSLLYWLTALETARGCHRLLAWAHALAYFLPKDNYKELFETHLSQLTDFVGALHGMTDGPAERLLDVRFREKALRLTKVIEKFRENVLNFCDVNYTHWSNLEFKAKLEVTCNLGHPLEKVPTRRPFCELCRKSQAGEFMWFCAECEVGRCRECYSKARKRLKNEKEVPPSPPLSLELETFKPDMFY